MSHPTDSDLAQGKAYRGHGVTVYYDARRCVHVANCVRALPAVFRPGERPWIQADQAPAQEVAAVVRTCPTGALHYVLNDEGPEQPEDITTVTMVPDGPLVLRGNLNIAGQREVRAALCRCGASSNKPYCDGTHAQLGWTSQ